MKAAGVLRHRVTIEIATDGVDETGAPTTSYAPYLTRIQAHVLPAEAGASGRENISAAQVQSVIDTKIRIRSRGRQLNEKMRVRHHIGGQGSPTRDDLYDIEAIVPADTPTTELWLLCRKRSTDGFRSGLP